MAWNSSGLSWIFRPMKFPICDTNFYSLFVIVHKGLVFFVEFENRHCSVKLSISVVLNLILMINECSVNNDKPCMKLFLFTCQKDKSSRGMKWLMSLETCQSIEMELEDIFSTIAFSFCLSRCRAYGWERVNIFPLTSFFLCC